MKVLVTFKGPKTETGAAGAYSLSVSPDDTVSAVKERLELIDPAAALPGARLVFKGAELNNDMRILDYEVKEGSSLDLVAGASAEDFVQQLAGLLKAKDLPLEELGLLYSHRHGATVGQVLKLLGRDDTLSHFLGECKQFVVEGGRVRLAAAQQKLPAPKLQQIPEGGKPPSAEGAKVSVVVRLQTPSAGESVTSLGLTIGAADTVMSIKEQIAEAEMIPFSDSEVSLDGKVLGDDQLLMDSVQTGGRLEVLARATESGLAAQLAGLLEGRGQRASSPDELSLLFCCKYGAPVTRALKLLGRRESLRSFLSRQEEFIVANGCVMLSSVLGNQVLDTILEAASFLNVHKVDRSVKGGSAKAMVYLAGLPTQCQERMMPGLLRSVAAGLHERLEGRSIGAIAVAAGAVQVTDQRGAVHELRFASMAQ